MFIGAHVSIAGGLANAPQNGVELGCETIQVFTRNQMQWSNRPLSESEIEGFRAALQKSKLSLPLSHTSYLINLGSPEESKLFQSRAAFENEIDRCEQLGITGLVFHPGAHMGAGVKAGVQTIIESINEVLKRKESFKTLLLVETTAGQGTSLGCTFEQVADIFDGIHQKSQVGMCIDTCHIFAAGYDIRTLKKYEACMRQLDNTIGLSRVKAFHLNDSQKELGSRVDRHARIGKGQLGLDPFAFILNDERFTGVPMIIEIPGDELADRHDLKLLKRLRNGQYRGRVSVGRRRKRR